MVSSIHLEPVSRTDNYKKVMKPLLERKRRARINRCLDELRDLLVAALQAEGETVTRLEKADILELTVRHVKRLSQRRRLAIPSTRSEGDPRQDAMKFQQGFIAAAQQVQSFLLSTTTNLEPAATSRLMIHLSSCASTFSNSDTGSYTKTTDISQLGSLSPATSPSVYPSSTTLNIQTSNNIAISKCSPPLSPPLMDLSLKSKVSQISPQLVVAPAPIRREPLISMKDIPAVPQDLSIRKTNQLNQDAWRPW